MVPNIKTIRVKNFRCLDELVISFEESPIISLKAGNDSGKSSVVKAIETAIYNDERDVKNYIRTGTKSFEIEVTLMDNTRILRTKSAAGDTYVLYDQQGNQVQMWDKHLSQTVPDIIRNIFNVRIEDVTGELLNLRTCESLLLFSLTKSTDNYKIVHSCISSQLIEKTYEIGNARIKELEKTIGTSMDLRDDYYRQAAAITVLDDDAINNMKNSSAYLDSLVSTNVELHQLLVDKLTYEQKQHDLLKVDQAKLEELINSKFSNEEIEVLQSLIDIKANADKIKEIEAGMHSDLIAKLIENHVDDKDIVKLEQLAELAVLAKSIQGKESELLDAEKLKQLEQAQEEIIKLENLTAELAELNNIRASIVGKQADIDKITQELNEVKETLKTNAPIRYDSDTDSLVKRCDNCNEEVYFSLKEVELL